MRGRIARGALGLLELVYPRRAICMGCGTQAGFDREWLCEACRVELARRWVGATTQPEDSPFESAAFAYVYGGPAASMVRNLKYHGAWRLSEMMGRHMARAFEPLQPAQLDCVVPVPMHPRRLRQRGYNHAALLAEAAARQLSLPVEEALERTRDTAQQARLGGQERRGNQLGAFCVTGDAAGRRVLLVDDVCTTGATAGACADALLQAGASAVCLLCFAVAREWK